MSLQRSPDSLLSRLKRPEYTGKNRCSTCTFLNSIIAAVFVVVIAMFSLVGAVAVLVVAVTSIAFRGYLIPGTPTLVQYLPDAVHDAIGSPHAVEASPVEPHEQQDDMLEDILLDGGVIEEVESDSELRFTARYDRKFHDRVNQLDSEETRRTRLADVIAVEPGRIGFERNDGWVVTVDGEQAGGWPSEAAFLADVANRDLLASALEYWHDLPDRDRTRLLTVLRAFVETCPTCGGDVVPEESVTQSCCRGEFVSVKTVCTDCGETLFEGTES